MATPAHRSVANIRPVSEIRPPAAPSASPRTPVRPVSISNFSSPSALRAEEDCIILEFGSRYLRAGLAGDALPKAVIGFGPDTQRRAGDYRQWQVGYEADWRQRTSGKAWGEEHELWKPDLRHVDLGLVGDRIERAMREAITKYLVTGSGSRRISLVLPPDFPLPLLSTVLDTLFTSFQPPTISLLSAPVLSAVAAGLRSALVIDVGWAETTVTGVYEYREISCRRTVRASRLLGLKMQKVLGRAIKSQLSQHVDEEDDEGDSKLISFEECEEVVTRMAWCKPSQPTAETETSEALSAAMESLRFNDQHDVVSIPVSSTQPPMTLKIPFNELAEPCEKAFFVKDINPCDLDDEELPLHLLVYRSLLLLPVDVRSVCMPRLILTGGGSNIPGLKNRILGDVQSLIDSRGWEPVQGKAFDQLRANQKLRSQQRNQAQQGPVAIKIDGHAHPETDEHHRPAAFQNQQPDPIESQIKRERDKIVPPPNHGTLSAVDSMGAWSGASLISQLRLPSVSIVEKDQWLQYGAAGASKAKEVIPTAKARQSMGPAGLRAAAAEQSSWTLGPWG
ncbi:hypothetical protein V502_09397 [Pseudogymnoascus sp. VKM F-4520 (FW-2644)]|nr:hypothetical protein V502_09397 [Pseudogymnoascus sp. VKM F-4520 (FW-2644)]